MKKTLSSKKWLGILAAILMCGCLLSAGAVYATDPYFHYHAPNEVFVYRGAGERYMNNGVLRNFDYDAIMIGTSMMGPFSMRTFDEEMGTHAVKVSFSGGTFCEMNNELEAAFSTHDNIRYVLRTLDYHHMVEDKDALAHDESDFPTYLTNRIPFDDVKYLLNKDVLFEESLPMIAGALQGKHGGFDAYYEVYDAPLAEGESFVEYGLEEGYQAPQEMLVFTEEEQRILTENFEQNVLELVRKNPETEFLLFFPPYSLQFMGGLYEMGELERKVAMERYVIELLLKEENIRIFSWNTDLQYLRNKLYYSDPLHINAAGADEVVRRIARGEGEITKENYEAYLSQETALYEALARDPASLIH